MCNIAHVRQTLKIKNQVSRERSLIGRNKCIMYAGAGFEPRTPYFFTLNKTCKLRPLCYLKKNQKLSDIFSFIRYAKCYSNPNSPYISLLYTLL